MDKKIKPVTLAGLNKLVFHCKKPKNCQFVNEIDLVLSSNSKDREKIKFIYSGYATLYRKKKLKTYKNTWDDYGDGEIINQWLENKHKKNKGDLVYIKGLIKYRGDKFWTLSALELCDNNLIASNCLDGVMVYQEV